MLEDRLERARADELAADLGEGLSREGHELVVRAVARPGDQRAARERRVGEVGRQRRDVAQRARVVHVPGASFENAAAVRQRDQLGDEVPGAEARRRDGGADRPVVREVDAHEVVLRREDDALLRRRDREGIRRRRQGDRVDLFTGRCVEDAERVVSEREYPPFVESEVRKAAVEHDRRHAAAVGYADQPADVLLRDVDPARIDREPGAAGLGEQRVEDRREPDAGGEVVAQHGRLEALGAAQIRHALPLRLRHEGVRRRGGNRKGGCQQQIPQGARGGHGNSDARILTRQRVGRSGG